MTALPTFGEVPDRGDYSEQARQRRLDWLRETSGAALGSLREPGIEARSLRGNIENFVATVEIPVGLAGPMLFTGGSARGLITAPLATTEGALVASVARGAKAITRSGGVTTQMLWQRMVRAPAFEFAGFDEAARFTRWVRDQRAPLAEQVALVSRHSRLVDVDPVQLGRVVHVRFVYETGEAAGQNMTTVGTWRACQWINEQVRDVTPTWFTVEGNLSGDKKLSMLNRIAGRGSRVQAECLIDHETMRRVLKTTAFALDKSWRLAQVAAQFSGMPAADIDAANVIAAMFVATGQDIAGVYESGAAMFTTEVMDDGLHATLILPNLVIGTVGGGTRLQQQNDYLDALGCAGEDGSRRLAEIICGFALALDLSTGAAVAGGQFADAHERLGRDKRVNWLRRESLDVSLIQTLMSDALEQPDLVVSEVSFIADDTSSSLLTEAVGAGEQRKFTGIQPLHVTYAPLGADQRSTELIATELIATELIAKVKPLDREVIIEIGKIASLCGGEVAEQYARWREWTGFKDTHTRELAIYRNADKSLRRIMPELYGLLEDPRREAYVLLLERLGSEVILKDSVSALELWERRYVEAAVDGIAGVHAAWLGREAELAASGWLGDIPAADRMVAMRPLWKALLEYNAAEYPQWSIADLLGGVVDTIADWWPELAAAPRTLIHGDFNPRNIALRAADLSLVAYDWELATVHVPQRDLVELLAFVLTPRATAEDVTELIELHRLAVVRRCGVNLDRENWRAGYRLALWDFAATRLQMYLLAHSHQALPFLDRVVPTAMRLLALESEHA